jgi:shikimate kinase
VVVQSRPMVIELVGLAGAGKSTLARELAGGTPPLQIDLPLSRMRSAAAQAAASARFVVPYLHDAMGTAWFSRDQVRGLGYLRAWRSAAAGRSGKQHLALDHGPLFRLAQLDAFGPPVTSTAAFRRWWDAMLDDWVDQLDVVVWLEAPHPILVRRIRARDQRHVLRTADDDAAQQFLGRYRASYDRILQRVRDRSPGAVLELRTDVEPPSILAARVRRRLTREARLDV